MESKKGKTMKKIFAFILSLIVLLTITGCVTDNPTIYKFDKDGKLIEKIEGGESSAIDKITESTKNKTVIAWTDGWAAYMTVSTATTENPTPTAKMFAGKVAKGVIAILKDQKNVSNIAKIIQATKTDLSVSASGIDNKSK